MVVKATKQSFISPLRNSPQIWIYVITLLTDWDAAFERNVNCWVGFLVSRCQEASTPDWVKEVLWRRSLIKRRKNTEKTYLTLEVGARIDVWPYTFNKQTSLLNSLEWVYRMNSEMITLLQILSWEVMWFPIFPERKSRSKKISNWFFFTISALVKKRRL